MTPNTPPSHQRHTGRRLAIAAGAVAVVVILAAWAAGALGALGGTATGGQLTVHADKSALSLQNEVPDGPPPATTSAQVVLAVPPGRQLTVPILYYHYIRAIVPTPQNLLSFDLSISPALFAEQMALLHVEGAHTITLAMLMDALAGKRSLPAHPVILTFDDGYADFATGVQPVMARYGFVATDYVVSGFLNRPRYMTAAQVRLMDAEGMVIGSHTVHHVNLAAIPLAEARSEIDGGKASLEKLLGHRVLDFAYPYGGFNAAIVQLVQQAGFQDAVTTVGGSVQSFNGPFVLRRIELGGAPSLARFAQDCNLPLPTAPQTVQIAEDVSLPPSRAV